MGKEEANRLLSKVAKFVRNPLKDWSELDSEEPAALENSYSREMLKEMIERRQRNDFVRRREFDMLRKLRQREAAGGGDAARQSPNIFCFNSRRCCASSESVAVGRASRRPTPIGSPVSSQ